MPGRKLRTRPFLLACLPAVLLAAGAQSDVCSTESAVDCGRQIYRSGLRSDGSAIRATVQTDVPVPAAAAACSGCHRRSGLGTAEAGRRSLPITAPTLAAPRTAAPARPAYDDTSLIRAIVQGIAADGRTLSALMPRYQLTGQDARALVAYLKVLGSDPAPGVGTGDIAVATVISDDAPPGEQAAVEQVLARYVEDKNAGMRREAQRAAAARRHVYGERQARAYRRWRLEVWRLRGPAATWEAQLERRYARAPVFALLSGTTGHDWSIVHQFCERREIPCILPLAEPPTEAEGGFYSLYFDAGARLAGRVTANHIAARQGANSPFPVVVAHDDSERGRSAWRAFSDRWRELQAGAPLREWRIDASAPRAPPDIESADPATPRVLVSWLDAARTRRLLAQLGSHSLASTRVYTAEVFADWTHTELAAATLDRVWHVYPYRLPSSAGARFPREEAWLRAKGLRHLDASTAGRVLFACHAFGEQLTGIESNFSRDYFMEGLEHMLDGTAMTTLYPRTTLGSGQRFLSRGAFVIPLAAIKSRTSAADAAWIPM
ncbi:MAG: c-type cytochrome [Steroidobacteraceae bacterium]